MGKLMRVKDSKRVGVIGCGAIGTIIAEAFERRTLTCEELVLYDYELERAERLKSQKVRSKERRA